MAASKQILDEIFPTAAQVPERERLAEPLRQKEFLLNGELHTWDGPTQTVLSPVWLEEKGGAVQVEIGSYPRLGAEQGEAALRAAAVAYNKGLGDWPTLPVEQRIKHVLNFTADFCDQREDVVRLLMWEVGKSRQDSEKEFDRTAAYIRDTVEALKDLDRNSSRFVIEEGIAAQIRRAPLGVVLCMGPYNYPLNETFATLIPALIMGNTVVVKPPKFGVLLYQPLLQAFQKNFPPGVVNFVYGSGQEIVQPMMASGLVDVLAFIGSARVADLLKKKHPEPHRLRCVLGMGAKNAGIVLPDAPLDLSVAECLSGSLSFNGQRCTAIKIIFVHRKILDDFLAKLTEALQKARFGMPWEPGAFITPLPESGKVEYLKGLLDDARAHGAKVVNPGGGDARCSFFAPALVCPVTPAMRLYEEEQFGPVVPIVPFDDLQDPIDYVVQSRFGQQLSIFGSDPDAIAELIDPLVNQVCRLNLNSQCQRGPDIFPFTGRKGSAEGTLSVSDALRSFSIRTLVAAKDNEFNRGILRAITRQRKSKFLSTDFIF